VTPLMELTNGQLGRVAQLFHEDQPNSAFIFSTLAGRTPGRAYVDDADDPQACALVINFQNLTFLGGRPGQGWLQRVVAQLRAEGSVLLSWPPPFTTDLEPPRTPTEVTDRFEFSDRAPGQGAAPIPQGHHLANIDAELLARCLWRNVVISAFGAEEKFLQQGLGLCLMSGQEIRCEAYAVFLGGGRFEIGVVTPKGYRQRGYAYVTCSHLIRACYDRGHPTCWSCEQDNLGSVATARKLGYQTQRVHQWLYYRRSPVTAIQGHSTSGAAARLRWASTSTTPVVPQSRPDRTSK
jgi:GNAT superfamily N-acetyltransferase